MLATTVVTIAAAKIQAPHVCHQRRFLTVSQKSSRTAGHASSSCKATLTTTVEPDPRLVRISREARTERSRNAFHPDEVPRAARLHRGRRADRLAVDLPVLGAHRS